MLLVTAIIQSSSATTVMIVGFVNAGVMNLFQATTMIMGANIGTTITAQIVALQSFDIVAYVAILAFIGIFMNMLGKKDKTKTIGLSLAGLGLVFISLEIMSGSMEAMKESEQVIHLLQSVNNPFFIGFNRSRNYSNCSKFISGYNNFNFHCWGGNYNW